MPHYEIVVDEPRRALRAALHGFWDLPTADHYLAELKAAGARISCGGAASWWLIDMGRSQVQGREVAERLRERLPAIFPPAMTLAIVVDASLPSVQAKRVSPNEHHRHFTTLAEADRWLIEAGMPK